MLVLMGCFFDECLFELDKFLANVCRDESDSSYKALTFHIRFYSWQCSVGGLGRPDPVRKEEFVMGCKA